MQPCSTNRLIAASNFVIVFRWPFSSHDDLSRSVCAKTCGDIQGGPFAGPSDSRTGPF